MTIFVANANGKVGSDLVAALLKGGYKVRVGARDIAKARSAFPGAEVVSFDYEHVNANPAAFDGVDSLFTAAPPWLLPNAETDIVALAKAKGVKRIVKLSYMGADQDDSASHRIAEKAIEASGLEWTHIRPTFFNQNYTTSSRDQVKSGAFYEPAADGASAYIDTRDIAAVTVKALTEPGHNGKAYELTGPEILNRSQVAEKLSAALGRPVAYVAVDDAALRQALAGAPPVLIELLSGLYAAVRAGYTARKTSTVRELLGREPISFEQFARDHVASWK